MPRTKPKRQRKRREKIDEDVGPKELASLVNKRYGEGTIRTGSDPYFEISRIPTGVLSIDRLLDGGFPRGRHVEIYGGYAVGKTYLTYRTIASAQQLGLRCAFIDVESTYDADFAASAGVDIKKLDVNLSDSHGEQKVDIIESMLRSGSYPGVIVLDSIASLLPRAELEEPMDAASYGLHQAKLMSKALRKLTAANNPQGTVLIYINQLRDSIGVIFGKKSVTSGGRAMSFYASTRLDMSRTETMKHKKEIIEPKTGDSVKKEVVYGHRVVVRVDKDKSGGSHTGATTSFVFNYELGGIDPVEDLIFLGRQDGHVHKRGDGWWVEGYDDERQQGRKRFVSWLRKNKAVQEELEQLITTVPDDDDQ